MLRRRVGLRGGGGSRLVQPPNVGAQSILGAARLATVRTLQVGQQLQVADLHVLGHVELVLAGVGAGQAAPQRVALLVKGLLHVASHHQLLFVVLEMKKRR